MNEFSFAIADNDFTLGGFTGLFMGLSLIGVFEISETALLVEVLDKILMTFSRLRFDCQKSL